MADIIDIGYRLNSQQVETALQRFKDLDNQVAKLDQSLGRLSNKQIKINYSSNVKESLNEIRQLDTQLKQLKNVSLSINVADIRKQLDASTFTVKVNPIINTQQLKEEILVVAKVSVTGQQQSGNGSSGLSYAIQPINKNKVTAIDDAVTQLERSFKSAGYNFSNFDQQFKQLNEKLGDRITTLSSLGVSRGTISNAVNQSIQRNTSLPDNYKKFSPIVTKTLIDIQDVPLAERALNSLSDTGKNVISTFAQMGSVLAIAGIGTIASQIVKQADAYELLHAKMRLVSTAGVDLQTVQDGLVNISNSNGMSLESTAKMYTRIVPALEGLKVNMKGAANETESAMRITNALANSLRISGASAQEARSTITQFSQALTSNRFGGDEWRSLTENSPALIQAIADGSGRARSELKKLSSDGAITTKFVVDALSNQYQILSDKAGAIPLTLGQTIENINTSFMVFADSFNRSTGLIDGLKGALDTIKTALDSMAGWFNSNSNTVRTFVNTLSKGFEYASVAIGTYIGAQLLATGAVSSATLAMTAYASISRSVNTLNGLLAASTLSMATVNGLATASIVALRTAFTSLMTVMKASPVMVFATMATAGYAAYDYLTSASEKAASDIDDSNKRISNSYRQVNNIDLTKMHDSLKQLTKDNPEIASKLKSLVDNDSLKTQYSADTLRQLADIKASKDKLQLSIGNEKNDSVLASYKAEMKALDTLQNKIIQKANLETQINAFTVGGGFADKMASMQEETAKLAQQNDLLKTGLSLRMASAKVTLLSELDKSLPKPVAPVKQVYQPRVNVDYLSMGGSTTPIPMPGQNLLGKLASGVSSSPIIQTQASVDEANRVAERSFTALNDLYKARKEAALKQVDDVVAANEKQLDIQAAILKSQKEKPKLSQEAKDEKRFQKEISDLQELIQLSKTYGNVEAARKAILGANSQEIEQHISLTKELNNLTRQNDLQSQIKDQQAINEALANGSSQELAVLQSKLASKDINQQTYDLEVKLLALKNYQQGSLNGILQSKNNELQLVNLGLSTEQSKTVELMTQYNILQGMSRPDALQQAINDLSIVEQKTQELEKQNALINKAQDTLQTIRKQDSNPLAGIDLSSLNNYENPFKGMVDSIIQMTSATDDYAKALEQARLQGMDLSKVQQYFARQELSNTASMLAATKGFFNEKSKSYKVLQAAERTYKAFELASTLLNTKTKIASLIQEGLEFTKLIGLKVAGMLFGTTVDTASTATEVANAGVRATAKGTESVVNSGKDLPFPANLAAMAATAAAVVALGVALSGGGSSGSRGPSASVTRGNGFGTALGDNTKSSDSIINSIEQLKNVNELQLEVSSHQLDALTKIRDSLSGFSTSIFQLNDSLGVKLRYARIFSTDIQSQTPVVQAYGGGEATSIQYATAFSEYIKQFFSNTIKTIQQSASSIGASFNQTGIVTPDIQITGIEKLNGKELEDRIQAVFSLLSDSIINQGLAVSKTYLATVDLKNSSNELFYAGQKLSQEQYDTLSVSQQTKVITTYKTVLSEFQHVGEGLLETLTRASSGLESASYYLNLINKSAISLEDIQNKQGDIGVEIFKQSISLSDVASGIKDIVGSFTGSIGDIAELYDNLVKVEDGLRAIGQSSTMIGYDLVNNAGGINNLNDYLDSYFNDILTPSERFVELQKRVSKQFSDIGLTLPSSVDSLKTLVQGIDDPVLLGKVLRIVPSFVELQKSFEDAASSVGKSMSDLNDNLRSAYDNEKSRLQKLIDSYTSLSDSLSTYSKTLSVANANLSPYAMLRETQTKFNETLQGAKQGNETNLKDLQTVSKDYLDAATKYYGTSSGYFDILAKVKQGVDESASMASSMKDVTQQQLDAITNQVGALIDLNDSVVSLEEAIRQYNEGLVFNGVVTSVNNQTIGSQVSTNNTTQSSNISTTDKLDTVIEKLIECSNKLDSIILVEQSGHSQTVDNLVQIKDEIISMVDQNRLSTLA